MSLKSSHSLTDQKYVNLVSWFHTWANTCLLYNTQWFNSNILIIIGPKIPISLHCNRRSWASSSRCFSAYVPQWCPSLQNAVIWLVEISAAIWLVEIMYPHGYWTNHLRPLKNGETLLSVLLSWRPTLKVLLRVESSVFDNFCARH